jgi:LysR family transcriptional regulator, regulator for bpeEF and oprC
MDPFNDLAVFAAVAETRAFSAAARRIGASTSGVSKSINRLEEELGVRLFTRTTRRVALTAEGEQFYPRCRDILEALSEAKAELGEASAALRGRIRIDMPIVFGERHVLPLLAGFRAEHPGVDLEIKLSDTITNLVEDNIDIAVRFGDLADSRIKAKRIGLSRLVTCASPQYLTKHGWPQNISDLERHQCLSFQFRTTGRLYRWRFKANGTALEFAPRLGITVNDGAAYRQLALLGTGIIQDLDTSVQQELEAGTLVEVLKPFSSEGFPLSIVWPDGHHQTRRVRILIDHLTSGLQRGRPTGLHQAIQPRNSNTKT